MYGFRSSSTHGYGICMRCDIGCLLCSPHVSCWPHSLVVLCLKRKLVKPPHVQHTHEHEYHTCMHIQRSAMETGLENWTWRAWCVSMGNYDDDGCVARRALDRCLCLCVWVNEWECAWVFLGATAVAFRSNCGAVCIVTSHCVIVCVCGELFEEVVLDNVLKPEIDSK